MEVPDDYKKLALALLNDAQLQEALNNPGVAEADKVWVRWEIARRKEKADGKAKA